KVETVAGKLSDALAQDHISVDERYAEQHDLKVGDTLTVTLTPRDKPARLTIGAITSAAASRTIGPNAKYVSGETAERYVAEERMPLSLVLFAQSVEGQEKRTYQALKAALDTYPQYTVRDQADYKELLEEQIGQLLNMVYGLLGLAIIVAVLGVVN